MEPLRPPSDLYCSVFLPSLFIHLKEYHLWEVGGGKRCASELLTGAMGEQGKYQQPQLGLLSPSGAFFENLAIYLKKIAIYSLPCDLERILTLCVCVKFICW